jgi:hypothetical protein
MYVEQLNLAPIVLCMVLPADGNDMLVLQFFLNVVTATHFRTGKSYISYETATRNKFLITHCPFHGKKA